MTLPAADIGRSHDALTCRNSVPNNCQQSLLLTSSRIVKYANTVTLNKNQTVLGHKCFKTNSLQSCQLVFFRLFSNIRTGVVENSQLSDKYLTSDFHWMEIPSGKLVVTNFQAQWNMLQLSISVICQTWSDRALQIIHLLDHRRCSVT